MKNDTLIQALEEARDSGSEDEVYNRCIRIVKEHQRCEVPGNDEAVDNANWRSAVESRLGFKEAISRGRVLELIHAMQERMPQLTLKKLRKRLEMVGSSGVVKIDFALQVIEPFLKRESVDDGEPHA